MRLSSLLVTLVRHSLAVLAVLLLVSAHAPTQAATATINDFIAIRLQPNPPFGTPYNNIMYDFELTWSGQNRLGKVDIDWYQNNVWNADIYMNSNSNSPYNGSDYVDDIARTGSASNYYRIYVRVVDLINPSTIYASAVDTDIPD